MHRNSTHLVRGDTRALLEKRGIWEAELREPATQTAAPLLGALQGSSTLRTLLSVHMPQLTLTSQAIKAQFNEGELLLRQCEVTLHSLQCNLAWLMLEYLALHRTGSAACFPMHVDSDKQVQQQACHSGVTSISTSPDCGSNARVAAHARPVLSCRWMVGG